MTIFQLLAAALRQQTDKMMSVPNLTLQMREDIYKVFLDEMDYHRGIYGEPKSMKPNDWDFSDKDTIPLETALPEH